MGELALDMLNGISSKDLKKAETEIGGILKDSGVEMNATTLKAFLEGGKVMRGIYEGQAGEGENPKKLSVMMVMVVQALYQKHKNGSQS